MTVFNTGQLLNITFITLHNCPPTDTLVVCTARRLNLFASITFPSSGKNNRKYKF